MIAGKTYTTLEAIDRMRTLCRVEKKGLGSGSENRGTTEVLNAMPLGSFSTAHAFENSIGSPFTAHPEKNAVSRNNAINFISFTFSLANTC